MATFGLNFMADLTDDEKAQLRGHDVEDRFNESREKSVLTYKRAD